MLKDVKQKCDEETKTVSSIGSKSFLSKAIPYVVVEENDHGIELCNFGSMWSCRKGKPCMTPQ